MEVKLKNHPREFDRKIQKLKHHNRVSSLKIFSNRNVAPKFKFCFSYTFTELLE